MMAYGTRIVVYGDLYLHEKSNEFEEIVTGNLKELHPPIEAHHNRFLTFQLFVPLATHHHRHHKLQLITFSPLTLNPKPLDP